MNSAEDGGWARASTSHSSHALLFTSVGRHCQCHLLGCQPSPQLHGEPAGVVHVSENSVVDDHADVLCTCLRTLLLMTMQTCCARV